jgi:hypothetical protein
MKASKRVENELSEGIHKVERYLEDRYRTSSVLASVHLDPQTYYNDRGWPSRFISIHYPNFSSEVRLNLQRNFGSGVTHAWTLGESTYVADILTYEFEKDFHNLPNILQYLRERYLGDQAASIFMSYGNKTFRVRNVRPPTVEELIGLDINPGAARHFIAAIPPGEKYHHVYDRTYILKV